MSSVSLALLNVLYNDIIHSGPIFVVLRVLQGKINLIDNTHVDNIRAIGPCELWNFLCYNLCNEFLCSSGPSELLLIDHLSVFKPFINNRSVII